ncbi:MAG: sigma 54-interacting transcriptional regulator [Acidobacteria bacterium]|nr:sigma 54-interacting transcriptional regulator [Acidobacteriota bacterium]
MGKRKEEELAAKLAELRNSETFSLLSATEMVEQIAAFLDHGLMNEAIAKQRRLPPPLNIEQAVVYAQLRSDIANHFAKHGYYAGVLDVLQPYDTVPSRVRLPIKERALISLQLAEAYSVNHNYPSAIGLLNESIKYSTQSGEKSLESKAQYHLGAVYFNLGEYTIAQDHLKQALRLFSKLGDHIGEAQAYLYLGRVLLELGEFDKSIEIAEKAIKISTEINLESIQIQAKVQIGTVWLRQGKVRNAIGFYEIALKKYEQENKSSLAIQTFNNLAYGLIISGNWLQAEHLLEKSLTLARQNQDDYAEAFSLAQFGLLYNLTGRINEAKPTLNFALELSKQFRAKDLESLSEINLGKLYLSLGEKALALTHLKAGIDIALTINRIDYAIEAEIAFILLCLEEGKLVQAQNALEQAYDWLKKQKNFLLEGKLIFLEAKLAFEKKQEALTKLNQAYEIFEVFSSPLEKALCLFERAQILKTKLGANRKIFSDLTRAQDLFEQIGAKPLLEKTNYLLKELFPEAKNNEINCLNKELIEEREQLTNLLRISLDKEELLKEIVLLLQKQSQADLVGIFELNSLENQAKLIFATKDLELLTNELQRRLQVALLNKKVGWIDGRSKDEPLYLASFTNSPEKPLILLFWGISPKIVLEESLESSINLAKEIFNLSNLKPVLELEPRIEIKEEIEIGKLKNFNNLPELVYSSRKMSELIEQITRIHSSDLTVLITGESGTGKDLIAKAVHSVSERRNRPFSPFNCTATPQEIVEAQLFGYRKGAFTGANIDYEGVIRAVDGGTLLLDEIGDLRLDIQPKLLRFLQDGEIQPIGYARPIRVNVRIIASTNRDLEKMVEKGEFREDLYHRLNILRLFVSPLRQRREEILPLAQYFLKLSCERTNKNLAFSPEMLMLIESYDWPGNIRQLKNEIERIVAFASENEKLGKNQLSQEILQATANLKRTRQLLETTPNIQFQTGTSLDEILMQTEKQIIQKSLKQCRNNIRQTAALLGISRKGLYDKIKRLKIRLA